jgi:hypothetical protein
LVLSRLGLGFSERGSDALTAAPARPCASQLEQQHDLVVATKAGSCSDRRKRAGNLQA